MRRWLRRITAALSLTLIFAESDDLAGSLFQSGIEISSGGQGITGGNGSSGSLSDDSSDSSSDSSSSNSSRNRPPGQPGITENLSQNDLADIPRSPDNDSPIKR